MKHKVVAGLIGLLAVAGAMVVSSLAANGQTANAPRVAPGPAAATHVIPPPPPPPPWATGNNGPIDMSKLPDKVHMAGPDGKLLRNPDGSLKEVTLHKGPPPLPTNVPPPTPGNR